MSEWLQRHARGLACSVALLVIGGAVSYTRLPSALYPELSFPRISVVAALGDATSEVVVRNVTRPLEEALVPLLGVRRVRSKTIRGACELDVLFDAGADMILSLQLVQARLAELRVELPTAVTLSVERITPTSFPVYTLNLDGALPPTKLRDLAMYELRPALSRVPGVGPISVTAGETREIEVEVDPSRAEAAGLSIVEIARRLGESNRFATVGRIDRAYRRYSIVVRTGVTDASQLGDFVVGGDDRAPIRLADVARVSEGHADPRMVIRSPRGPAAVINISRRIGGDVVALDHALDEEVARLRAHLPLGVALTPVYQQAALVKTATSAVRDAILLGAALSALVVLLFLRDGRATLVSALVIPASLLCACGALYLRHGSLDLMSLGGMAIAVGLVIDDAVVVIEAIQRERRRGLSPQEATRAALQGLAGPIVSSTLTTVVVFAPLAFLSGVVGTFFASLALALSAAIFASLVLALTVVPWVASAGGKHDPAWELRLSAWVARTSRRWVERPLVLLIVAAVILVGAGVSMRWIETGFVPALDEGAYVFDYHAPIGTSLAETDALASRIDAILRADPDVQTFTRRLGAEMGPPRATETSRGDVIVRLKPHHRPIAQLMEEQRAQAAALLPGVRIELLQLMQDMLGDLEGNSEPVEVKVFGPDEPGTRAQAARVAEQLKSISGLVDLFDGQVACSPERVVVLDPVALGRLGLTTADVASQMSSAQLGVDSAPLAERDRLVPVRVRWPDAVRFRDDVLQRVRLRTAKGFVPLAVVAHVSDGCAPSEITRENLRLMVPVTARLDGTDLGTAMREVDKRLATLKLPQGYDLEIGGQRLSQRDSFTQLALALLSALALVTIVLVFQLGTLRAAASVLAAIPIALCGALVTLALTRVALNISSLLGGILLVGLVVKNGILLVHETIVREAEGRATLDALSDAITVRLRPILMTTLCTLLGLVPLALGLGAGAELHRPLAVAVIGGLVTSTLGTLVFVPAVYARLARIRVASRTQ
ncbi:MAG: efflux RND transporter permease subunit [Polyangia bacterium]